ncbi:SDR family NAD(P)-dependent oxidoreductase, partial [candidate division KSB1 bacterium]|nr:SDR family NAD(P)-dependent oxidoreductase [candidate division KSB1 bacterium]
MRLQNKIVLVTGASRGIGRAVSLAFAREGADVFVHYRSDSVAAERVADDIHGLGRQAWLLQADLSEPDQIETLFTNLYKNCDVLDILVNNAGFEFGKPFDEFTTREWDDILNVNLRAVFLCMKHAVKRMRARGSGSIINISSIHDTVPRPNFAPYCVSKAGLLMLTKT